MEYCTPAARWSRRYSIMQSYGGDSDVLIPRMVDTRRREVLIVAMEILRVGSI
jgi:hypothetical protein